MTAVSLEVAPGPSVCVVLFSGGRGSGALATTLVRTPGVRLTIAINGYDDGSSTGEVRRFLGDSLGPSDFRKNASRLARELGSCQPAVIDILDERLPAGLSLERGADLARSRVAAVPALTSLLDAFLEALAASGQHFHFDGCSIGNLVFAGVFLRAGRRFNVAVDNYCALVGLGPG